MKKFFETIGDAVRSILGKVTGSLPRAATAAAVAIVIGLGAALSSWSNPTQEPEAVYWLTNSGAWQGTNGAVFQMANGGLMVTNDMATNIYSTPFTIWRGRGFTLNFGMYQTNGAGTDTWVAAVRYGQVHLLNGISGSGYSTNWITTNQYAPQTFSGAPNGTNYAFWSTNIQPAAVDNVSVGQLVWFENNGTNPIYLDPSNTFAGSFP